MTRKDSTLLKKHLMEVCKELGIAVRERATVEELKYALEVYYSHAAVIKDNGEMQFVQTGKDTKEYTFEITSYGSYTIRAENASIAREWAEYHLGVDHILRLGYGDEIELLDFEVGDLIDDYIDDESF